MTAIDPTEPSIRVDLREGFEGDEVVLRLDGEEVFRKEGVTTLPQIGRADGIDVHVGHGPVTVQVELPNRGLSGSYPVPGPGVHLGISVEKGGLTHEISPTPFRYA